MLNYELFDFAMEDLPFIIKVHKDLQAEVPSHWHRAFEISFTIEGSINEFKINGIPHETQKGDILIVNPNEIHSIKVNTPRGHKHEALTMVFPYEFMKKNIENFSYRYYHIPHLKQMTDVQKKILKDIQNKLLLLSKSVDRDFERLKMMSLVFEILHDLTEHFSEVTDVRNDILCGGEDMTWINEVIFFIQENYSKPLSIEKLSDHFHLSPSYFSRKFKKQMNISVMNYVYLIRLNQAHNLIVNSDHSIQYISDRCGFPNTNSFNRYFKEKYKETPLKYRHKVNYQNYDLSF
ncbi:AraC family transcriptional regulator [Vagococcus lutrae]|uniref:AraC family transcriptional regulator n=1 Tax=Vagococcus lutrae TaxID=81947 RepID=UPI002A7F8A3A|nr:AraC family transcriptional regulator [Vagococcus lutrae]MDY3706055.1 AraC family transcriptional regulator [Vagococcus lutrae]